MKLSVIVATFERPAAIRRFIASVRTYYPELKIYVADQSSQTREMELFYEAHNVDVSWVGHDVGVSRSRNILASKVATPYFLLCDDDFIITRDTSFDGPLAILESCLAVGVIGGKLIDTDGKSSWERHWEHFFQYDKKNRMLFAIPLSKTKQAESCITGCTYYKCDAVLNWAVMRTEMFNKGVAWDEQFKSNGEHEDFYLNLKLNFNYDVAYTPDMIAIHHHIGTAEYEKYRDRNEGWELFLRKWNLEQMVEIDFGFRHVDSVDFVKREEAFRARSGYFLIDKNRKLVPLAAPQISSPGDVDYPLQTGTVLPDDVGKQLGTRFDAKGRKLRIDRRLRRLLAQQVRLLGRASKDNS